MARGYINLRKRISQKLAPGIVEQRIIGKTKSQIPNNKYQTNHNDQNSKSQTFGH
jgi:hypothetical protein